MAAPAIVDPRTTLARTGGVWRTLAVVLVACRAPASAPPPSDPPAHGDDVRPAAAASVVGQLADGRTVEVVVDGDRIARVDRATAAARAARWLWPPIVDSHVHLAIWPVADRLAASGVAAAVDLAAPEPTLGAAAPVDVIPAGPMLTRPGGYPLYGWGHDGYGVGCADAACVRATIDRLVDHGARVIKVAADGDGLDPALLPIAAEAAHARGVKLAVHALTDDAARRAAAAGADVLGHTPVEALADATIAAWAARPGAAVISTLAAFGGGDDAVANLRRLRAAGLTVLYGTDLGNLRDAGPSADEVALLRRAGLDDAAITAAMTTTPAAFWHLPLGLAPGAEASWLVLDRDPRRDAGALLAPSAVWSRGRPLAPITRSGSRP